MKCKVHTEREAVAACVGCGEPVCPECDVLVGGRHFCRRCLAEAADVPPTGAPRAAVQSGGAKPLTRSRTDRWLSGVCGGIAAHTGMDATLVRLLAVILVFASGIFLGLIGYVVAACVIPEEGAAGSN